jgi:hypothetical protein
MTVTQDERLSNRVFNSDIVFCSKADAFLYVVLHRRDPDEQKTEVPTCQRKVSQVLTHMRTDLRH